MFYSIYKLHPHFHNGAVYKGTTEPEFICAIDTGNLSYCEYMDKNWYDTLAWREDFQKALELDTNYYVIAKDYSDFGILRLHKGYTFFDVAEHDERVIIASELGLTREEAKI